MAADRDAAQDAEDTVSLGELGRASRFVRQVAETGRPVVVIDDGIEVAVILDALAYRALQPASATGDLRSTLLAAMAEVEAGTFIDDAKVMADVHAELEGAGTDKAGAELDRR